MDIFLKQIKDRKFMLEKSLEFTTVRRDIIVWECVHMCDVLCVVWLHAMLKQWRFGKLNRSTRI